MRKLLLTPLFALIIGMVYGTTYDASRTAKIAVNFYYEQIQSIKSTDYKDVKIESTWPQTIDTNLVYTVCNMKNGGFVIVSEYEGVVPVLGFSFSGSFTPDNIPPACQMWVKSYALQIDYAIKAKVIADEKIAGEWQRLTGEAEGLNKSVKTGVLPMLFTQWDQGLYYNAMCPVDGAGPGGHVVTGCVATALGQLLNYFRFPVQGSGSYGYEHPDYGWIEEDFSQQTYDYDLMPIELTDFCDDAARLIYNIGVSVDMNYGPDGSGMWNHKGAYTLRTYFGFNSETTYLFRDSLPEDFDWKGTLIQHLDQKIPLYYAGWGDYEFVSGHAFILDGYQTDEYYHINWGWGGSSDGYFYIDNLTPGGNDFTLLHEVIVNAVPANNYPGGCQSHKVLNSFSGTIDDGSGPMFDYENDLDCEWLIQPIDSASGILIDFLKLNTDANDFITIFDGPNTESPVIGVYSGTDIPGQIETSSMQVLVKFTSDASGVADGFLLSFKGVKPDYCTLINNLTEPTGIITDGSGSFNYQNSENCYWYIQPENAQSITIHFTEFDLQPTYDYVKILNASNQTVANYSGITLPEDVVVDGYKATVNFKTNGNTRAGGFTLNYTTQFVGIDGQADNGFKVFPNPADNQLNIQLNSSSENLSIELISSDGKIVKKLTTGNIGSNESIKLDISSLQPGLYLVRIITQKGLLQKKVLIQ